MEFHGNPFQDVFLQPDDRRNHLPEQQFVSASNVRQQPYSLGIENNQAPNPYVANAGSVYQPTASDMAYSHVKLMRSQFHKKMKTVLLSISSLSGNNYNLENPENAIFERTRNLQEYHEACLQEIENLAKQKNALDYLHRNRERYDRIRKEAKDNQMLPFHQCLKTLDRKYFIEERGYYSCGNVDVSSESLSVISAFEKVIERFGKAVGVTNYNNSLY